MANSRKPKPFTRILPSDGAWEAPKDLTVDLQDPAENAAAETDANEAEAPPAFIETLETGAAQLDEFQEPTVAEINNEANGPLAPDFTTIASGIQAIQGLMLRALKENMEANMAFMRAFAQARTLSETVSLQSAHVSKQYDAVSSQWKNLASAARRLAFEGAEAVPGKA